MAFRSRELFNKLIRKVGRDNLAPGVEESLKKCLPNKKCVMGRAKRGLYAGRHIQFGNQISEDGGNNSGLQVFVFASIAMVKSSICVTWMAYNFTNWLFFLRCRRTAILIVLDMDMNMFRIQLADCIFQAELRWGSRKVNISENYWKENWWAEDNGVASIDWERPALEVRQMTKQELIVMVRLKWPEYLVMAIFGTLM